uniref:SFRICE_024807 n=1 Tax=Spodoptera frugiperda TaxID=7108 RepID=A0A2H1VT72_SPOFR
MVFKPYLPQVPKPPREASGRASPLLDRLGEQAKWFRFIRALLPSLCYDVQLLTDFTAERKLLKFRVTEGLLSAQSTSAYISSKLRNVAASAHADHDKEYYDLKLVELSPLMYRSINASQQKEDFLKFPFTVCVTSGV